MSIARNGQNMTIPSSMESKLRTIQKRLIGRTLLRAAAIGGAVLILLMIVSMIVDWSLMLFAPAARVALTAGSLLAALIACFWAGYRPLSRALGWADAAKRVDDETPLLEERWTTVLTFTEQEVHPVNSTMRAMLQHVTSEAIAMGELVEPKAITRSISPRKALFSLAGCLLLCAGFLAINWSQTSILLQRFWNPTANITATQLESVTGDLTTPRGETVNLIAKLSGLPRDEALLTVKYESGINEVFPLDALPDAPHNFLHSLRVDESFEYQLAAGDGRTDWHRVTAIDYPLLDEISFRVIPPAYLDRAIYEKTWIPSRVKVAEGSRLELLMKPDIPLEQFHLKLTRQPLEGDPVEESLTLKPAKNGSYLFELPLLDNLTLEPSFRSLHGLSNETRQVCRIEVVPDMAPIARVITPNDESVVADDDVVKIEFEAHDDHGIETAELVIYDESTREEGKEPEILEVRSIDLKEQAHQKHVMAETELDLKELNLEPGRQISVSVRVTDNRTLTSAEREQMASLAQDLKDTMAQQSEAGSSHASPKRNQEPADTQKSADDQQSMIATAEQNSDTEEPGNPSATAKNDGQTDTKTPGEKSDSSEKVAAKSDQDGKPDGKETDPADPSDKVASKDEDDQNPDGPDSSDKKPTAVAKQDSDKQEEDKSQRENSEKTTTGEKVAANDDKQGEKVNAADPGDKVASKDEDDQNPDGSDSSDKKPTAVASKDGDQEKDDDTQGEQNPGEKVAANDDKPGESKTDAPDAQGDPKDPTEDAKAVATNESTDPKADGEKTSDKAPMPGTKADGEQVAEQSPPEKYSLASNTNIPSSNPSESKKPQKSMVETVPLDKLLAMTPQSSDEGQNVESNRKKLKITKRLASATEKVKEPQPKSNVRDRVVALDAKLAVVETGLQKVLKREIPDADREEQFQRLDQELLSIEELIADLRNDTKDGRFAFVGLQMVEIGRFHVTPARDHVFSAMQSPVGSDSNTSKSLHHIERAREELAALLNQYDNIVKEDKLEDSLKETVKMYEVYVRDSHKLMREARQNKHPLDRKMEVIEVDQAFLDRVAEVEGLRREMLAELARMLADDPRLASRYLDLIKRRRASLLEQLSELTERQEDLATELSGWLAVDESQRKDLWTLIVDMRLQTVDQMASDTAEFSEQMVKQLPLSLDADRGTASAAVRFVQDAAQIAREISFETRNMYGGTDQPSLDKVAERTAQLLTRIRQTERALDRLIFENDGVDATGAVDEVVEYGSARLVELQVVSDRVNDWNATLQHIIRQDYPPIASGDQRRLGIATEVLRVSLLAMEDELEQQFADAAQRAGEEPEPLPQEIRELVYELQQAMEGITLNQAAATYSLTVPDLTDAELQQYKALEGFQIVEHLFEKIRRTVVKHLDEYDVLDPTIDQLEDPTLDRFLEALEREPNIQARLGIPDRPRNLRIIRESMQWQQIGTNMLNESVNNTGQRMKDELKKKQQQEKMTAGEKPKDQEQEKRDREADTKDLEEMIRRSVAKLEEKMENKETTEAERKKLEAMAENMKRFLKESRDQPNSQALWRKLVESDQAEAMLKAMARGEALPDQQWNKILSTLNEGLWQIHGRTPPEEYRKSIEQYQDQVRRLIDAGASRPQPTEETSSR